MAIAKQGKTGQARFWWKDNAGIRHSKTKDEFKSRSCKLAI